MHKNSKKINKSTSLGQKDRRDFDRTKDLRSSTSMKNSKKAFDVLTGQSGEGTLNKRFGGTGKFL